MNLFLQYIFAKLGMTYIDFLKHGQFEGVAQQFFCLFGIYINDSSFYLDYRRLIMNKEPLHPKAMCSGSN